ncbi:MAG: hypothetical protein GX442_13205 [Candidatus Riflebacteria bacterium]|nr:hypothetical protein [Candidatus Riflebacteria bacterium]
MGNPETRPCPFCAEPILAEAKKCRHCQSMLVDDRGRPFVVGVAGGDGASPRPDAAGRAAAGAPPPPRPSLWSLMLANLLCPGLGTWRLGRRLRGFVIGAGLILAVLLYAQEALPIYAKVMQDALRGHMRAFSADQQAALDAIVWHQVAIGLFLYSFVDVWLVHRETR